MFLCALITAVNSNTSLILKSYFPADFPRVLIRRLLKFILNGSNCSTPRLALKSHHHQTHQTTQKNYSNQTWLVQITTFCLFFKTSICMQKTKHLNIVGKWAKKNTRDFRNEYYQNYFAFFKDSGHRTLIPDQHIF